jgi:hypothetical protein
MAKSKLKDPKKVKKSKTKKSKTLKEKPVIDLVIEESMGFIQRLRTDPEFAKKWGYQI